MEAVYIDVESFYRFRAAARKEGAQESNGGTSDMFHTLSATGRKFTRKHPDYFILRRVRTHRGKLRVGGAPFGFVCLRACLSAYNSAPSTGRIFVKFGTRDFYTNLSRNSRFRYNRNKMQRNNKWFCIADSYCTVKKKHCRSLDRPMEVLEVAAGRIKSMTISNDPIGNRTAYPLTTTVVQRYTWNTLLRFLWQ